MASWRSGCLNVLLTIAFQTAEAIPSYKNRASYLGIASSFFLAMTALCSWDCFPEGSGQAVPRNEVNKKTAQSGGFQ